MLRHRLHLDRLFFQDGFLTQMPTSWRHCSSSAFLASTWCILALTCGWVATFNQCRSRRQKRLPEVSAGSFPNAASASSSSLSLEPSGRTWSEGWSSALGPPGVSSGLAQCSMCFSHVSPSSFLFWASTTCCCCSLPRDRSLQITRLAECSDVTALRVHSCKKPVLRMHGKRMQRLGCAHEEGSAIASAHVALGRDRGHAATHLGSQVASPPSSVCVFSVQCSYLRCR